MWLIYSIKSRVWTCTVESLLAREPRGAATAETWINLIRTGSFLMPISAPKSTLIHVDDVLARTGDTRWCHQTHELSKSSQWPVPHMPFDYMLSLLLSSMKTFIFLVDTFCPPVVGTLPPKSRLLASKLGKSEVGAPAFYCYIAIIYCCCWAWSCCICTASCSASPRLI